MKRSEFVAKVAAECDGLTRSSVAESAARTAEEGGMKWDPEVELPKNLALSIVRKSGSNNAIQVVVVDEGPTWRYLTREEANLLVDDYNRRASGTATAEGAAELPTLDLQEIVWKNGMCRGLYPKPVRIPSLASSEATFTVAEAVEIVRRCNSWSELRTLWAAYRDGHSHPYAKVRDRITAILSGVSS